MDKKLVVLGLALILAALILLSGCVTYDKCDLNKDGQVSDIEKQKCEQGDGNTSGKCGDGICGAVEKEKSLCPQDCEEKPPNGKCGDGVCGAKENPQLCPEDCAEDDCKEVALPSADSIAQCEDKGGKMKPSYDDKNCISSYKCSAQIAPSMDYGIDADGFFWGVEEYPEQIEGTKDILANTLKPKYLKIRLQPKFFSTDDWENFSSAACLPSPSKCQSTYNMDDIADIFKENGWSMVPMITYDTADLEITDEDIEHYVNFVDWFVSRYKDDAGIEYVELTNNPNPRQWSGTYAQLLELNNQTYERIKGKFPDIMMGTPGFEYWNDVPLSDDDAMWGVIEYFLDAGNGAKFDFWAFHGYPTSIISAGTTYPPTRTSLYNKYAGIPGILEIRKQLNANGWQNRKIIDTEHTGAVPPKTALTDETDRVDAAYTLQELLLKKTLQYDGDSALSGILHFKMVPRGNSGEASWGSLNSDGSATQTVNAAGLLLSRLDKYNYSGRISGEFDNENEAWIEKFSSGSKELYIFFKPFEYRAGQTIDFDSKKADYAIALSQTPKSISLTDMYGTSASIAPGTTIAIEAENSPKFLEIEYD